MTHFNRFFSYYIRSAMPFLSGLAYGIFLIRWEHPLWLQVLAGLILVVVGPFAIRIVLTLIVEALRGVPEQQAASSRAPDRPSDWERDRPLQAPSVHSRSFPPANVESRPRLGPFSRSR